MARTATAIRSGSGSEDRREVSASTILRIVLHSTRHTGISQLTGVGVPQDIREILAGHAAAGVHGQVYVHRDSYRCVCYARGWRS